MSSNTSLNLTRYVGASRLVARMLAWRYALSALASLMIQPDEKRGYL